MPPELCASHREISAEHPGGLTVVLLCPSFLQTPSRSETSAFHCLCVRLGLWACESVCVCSFVADTLWSSVFCGRSVSKCLYMCVFKSGTCICLCDCVRWYLLATEQTSKCFNYNISYCTCFLGALNEEQIHFLNTHTNYCQQRYRRARGMCAWSSLLSRSILNKLNILATTCLKSSLPPSFPQESGLFISLYTVFYDHQKLIISGMWDKCKFCSCSFGSWREFLISLVSFSLVDSHSRHCKLVEFKISPQGAISAVQEHPLKLQILVCWSEGVVTMRTAGDLEFILTDERWFAVKVQSSLSVICYLCIVSLHILLSSADSKL